MRGFKFAVLGALGAVGQQMLNMLDQSDLPIESVKPLDVKQNNGKKLVFRNKEITVEEVVEGSFKDVDIALFSAGAEASMSIAPMAVQEGAVVIDNSSAWRMDNDVPLVIPEVNPHDLDRHKGLIANPNCSTIQMLVALKPIHDRYIIKRIVVSTYQAVSGSGQRAIDELISQITGFVNKSPIESSVYPYQIAFNALPHIDIFQDNGYTKEEMKMVNETKKILDRAIEVNATAVRIPVFRCHSESVNIETAKPIDPHDVRLLLKDAPGIRVIDDVGSLKYPMAIQAEGKGEVFVGRIRKDYTIPNGLNMWIVADNLLKGASLNAVQIAETLIARNLV
ncbi:MAG: Aspartate-semialdehyde dehydrogenase [Firmicutes bacterium]|nr:Aspartate-semialdehyde dehydrogenase [Bacillota bacterium]MDI6706945.1 aspartate-semialdehyde dehydrogenase [Bacillota bacterium]